MIQRLKEMDSSRWLDQAIGAFFVVIASTVLGWVSGFVNLPNDVRAIREELRASVKEVHDDMDRRTAERKQADADISHRMDVADEMHVKIIQEHREIREAIPYSINRTLDRGRREGAAR